MKKVTEKKWSFNWGWPYDRTVYVEHSWPLLVTALLFIAAVSPTGLGHWAGHVVQAYKNIVP